MRLRLHGQDPAPLLARAFTRIWRERMADLPMLNTALVVEAIGFQPWNGHWLGVLVTPWAMSLVLLPKDAACWLGVAPPKRRFVKFPFGDLAFLESEEPELGAYQACSLFSTMDGFPDQAAARATARASLAALLAPAPRPEGVPAAPAPRREPVPSRRRFLGLRA